METHAICIHGHFYQPPREDPLTGKIPVEAGAAPYPNWNERIFDQCYRPNAELENFQKISFNIGPTLNEWLKSTHPMVLEQIISQDQYNVNKHGVGNAMAQAYNHTILPLSTRVDKETQVRWGIAEFMCRFGHRPQGMWLPEAAVDMETLEVLEEHGIEFVILAPWQADKDNLDVSHPYRVELSGGKQITAFFYDEDLSMRVSFDPGATVNADQFVLNYVLPKFSEDSTSADRLYLVASDGELYGHHQPFRDKFLAYLMDGVLEKKNIEAVYPGLWLKKHPATETIRIRENTSWSCHHGVSRWKEACGCAAHGEWKAPLRQAFNQIADAVDQQYLSLVGKHLENPWELRHSYTQVLCGKMQPEEYIQSMLSGTLTTEETQAIELLLRAQFERQRMFTSCGWFFGDFDRIEPRNNIAYAAQAVWLTEQATGVDLSEQALNWLKPVKSWRSGLRGDQVFQFRLEKTREAWQKVVIRQLPTI